MLAVIPCSDRLFLPLLCTQIRMILRLFPPASALCFPSGLLWKSKARKTYVYFLRQDNSPEKKPVNLHKENGEHHNLRELQAQSPMLVGRFVAMSQPVMTCHTAYGQSTDTSRADKRLQ